MKNNLLNEKELNNRLRKKACSNWFDLKAVQPNRYDWVLVNTQYCTYPATIAKWNGVGFKSTEGDDLINVTHWANVNDLGMGISPVYNENEQRDRLKIILELLEKVIELLDVFKNENKYWKSFYHSTKYGISFISKKLKKTQI